MQTTANKAWQLWRAPLVLNAVMGAGLACALLGDAAAWRVAAWLCLLLPVGAIGFYACDRFQRHRDE